MDALEVRPWWQKWISNPITLVTLLALLLAVPRFYWLLSGQYNYIILLFILMWAFPFVFLTRDGRRTIGLKKPTQPLWLIFGFVLGLTASVLIYFVGTTLFDHTENNWYMTIMGSFNKDNIIEGIKPSIGLFLLVTFPTMVFSPIGEEFFFRGMIHESYASKYGNNNAMIIDASFFGITHLAHHGLLMTSDGPRLLPSAFIWILMMMFVSILLFYVRKKSGSIWGAVTCHAGFNFGMMGSIVYLLHE